MQPVITKQKIIGGAVIIGALIVAFISYYVFQTVTHDTTLLATFAPETVKMSYDSVKNQVIKSDKPVAVKSGKHTFSFSADGYDTYTVELDLEKGKERNILFALTPKTDKAKNELKQKKYAKVFDGLGSREVNRVGKEIDKANPILQHLPFEDRDYRVFSCQPYRTNIKKSHKIGICITMAGRNGEALLSQILEKLAKLGATPDNYDMKVNNYIIPTKKEKDSRAAVPCGNGRPSWCYKFRDY